MAIIDGFPATSFDARDRKWVKEVAEDAAGAALPDTSEASQGDVLTLGSDGPEWDTPSGGGGGTTFINGTITEYDSVSGIPIAITFDKTYAQICAMIEDGIYPMFNVTINNFPINIFPIRYVGEDGIAWTIYTVANNTPVYVNICTYLDDDLPVYEIYFTVYE